MIQFFVRLYYKIVEKIVYNFINRKLLSEELSQEEFLIISEFSKTIEQDFLHGNIKPEDEQPIGIL